MQVGRVLVLWLLVVGSVRAQDAIDLRIVRGARAAGAWAIAAARAPEELAAVAAVRARLAHGTLAPRLRRLGEDIAALEGKLGGAAKAPTVGGKLLVLLAMDQPAWGTAPEVGCAAVLEGQGKKLYAVLGARGLKEGDESLALALEDVLAQSAGAVREVAFALGYQPAYRDEGWWTANAATLFATSSPADALADAALAAREVVRFKAELARATGDGHLAFGPAAAARAYVPPGKRLLMRLAELSEVADAAELETPADTMREAYGLDWSDPALERAAPGGVANLRDVHDMLSCPAFVSTVLADLYGSGLVARRRVQKTIQSGSGLDALIEDLAHDDPPPAKAGAASFGDVLAQIVARRAHGANLDAGEAEANLRDFKEGKQDGAAFAKRHQKVLTAKGVPAAPPAVIADALAQAPLQFLAGHATAAGRVRMLAGTLVDAEKVLKLGAAMSTAHTVEALSVVMGEAPEASDEQHGVAVMPKLSDLALHKPAEWGLEKLLPRELEELLETTTASGIEGEAAAHVAKGAAALVVVEIFVHQVFHHNYGFLGCDADPHVKFRLILKTLVDFSNWKWSDAALIGAHVGVYAMATGAAVLAGAAGVAVPVIGFVAVLAVDLLVAWVAPIFEEMDHRELSWGIGYMLERYLPDAWGPPSSGGNGALEGQAFFPSFGNTAWSSFLDVKDDVTERRRRIRERMGHLTTVQSNAYDCEKVAEGQLAFQPVNGLSDGALKEWLQYEDAELGHWLSKVQEAVADRRQAIDDAQEKLSVVSNPLVHELGLWDAVKFGVLGLPPSQFNDLESVVPLLAIDKDGNDVSAREIADHVTYLKLAARGAKGSMKLDDVADAEIDAIQADCERRVAQVLAGRSKLRLVEAHWEAKGDYDGKVADARADVAGAIAKMQEWLHADAPGLLDEIAQVAHAQAQGMVRDIEVDRLDAIPELQDVALFLQARRKSLEALEPACRRASGALASTPVP